MTLADDMAESSHTHASGAMAQRVLDNGRESTILGQRDYRDRAVVRVWIGQMFARNPAQRRLLRVVVDANNTS